MTTPKGRQSPSIEAPDPASGRGLRDGQRASPGVAPVGREVELGRIRRALDALPRRGAAVHIVGDPGVGKTELLRAVTREARSRGLRVLYVRGTASESHLTFAALHLLLRPILDRADALPGEHRRALLGAFGLAESAEPPERLFVALAALELIADTAAEAPVVVAVDDLPWTDEASREAIEFVARRIDDEPALMLLTSRSGASHQDADDVAESLLQLTGLDASASRQLLRDRAPGLTSAEEEAVLDAAAGNPLALLELPQAVALDRVSPSASLLPLTARLERAFAIRWADLPPATRTTLLVATLQDSERLGETRAALVCLTSDGDAPLELQPAIDARLLTVEGDSFRFRHPLVRSAIAQSVSAEVRAKVHLALAQSLGAAPDRAAWHRSLAISHPDEGVAAELDEGAERALARGAPDIAERWLERAAQLSVDGPRKAHRLVRAAELAFELGRHAAVDELMAQARALPAEDGDHARLSRLEGTFDDGTPGDRDRILRLVDGGRRAGAAGDEDVAASLLLGAAMSCYWGAAEEPVRAYVRQAAEALRLAISDPRRMVLHALIDPFASGPVVVDLLAEWAQRELGDSALAGALARTAFVTGEFERGLTFAGYACDGLRRQGRVALLTQALVLQTFSALYLGRWDITNVASGEAYRFAIETRQPVWEACARLGQANLAALRGGDASAAALAATVERTALTTGNRSLLNGVQLARGLAALGSLRPEDAFSEFVRMFDPDDLAYHSPQSAWAIDYLAESAQLAGRLDDARTIVQTVDELTDGTPACGVVRALTLARALVAEGDEAETFLQDARRLAATATPWFRARVDLTHGAWLRRRRRVAESRRPLASAQAVFDALGARAWAQRAGQELAATGQHPRRRQPEAWARLSAQELQIARLAAEGLSNREIGQRLYLSHRTVASHLYRVFPKLGVNSRAQLHLALPQD